MDVSPPWYISHQKCQWYLDLHKRSI